MFKTLFLPHHVQCNGKIPPSMTFQNDSRKLVNEVEEHELIGSIIFLLEKGGGVEIYFLFSMCFFV
jgi:hypothetical protein